MSYGRSGRGYGGGYNNNSYRGSGFEKPVQTGKEYDVKITETGSRGDGIARIQGFVVFVKNGKVGQDTVKVKINSVGDRFAIAEPVILEAPATSSSTPEE